MIAIAKATPERLHRNPPNLFLRDALIASQAFHAKRKEHEAIAARVREVAKSYGMSWMLWDAYLAACDSANIPSPLRLSYEALAPDSATTAQPPSHDSAPDSATAPAPDSASATA